MKNQFKTTKQLDPMKVFNYNDIANTIMLMYFTKLLANKQKTLLTLIPN